jgi:uncharacterized protein (TIGR03437 family)
VDFRNPRVHVLTIDDTLVGNANCTLSGPCGHDPYITHPDGSLVSFSNPAHAGETIVVYAVGLGKTTPTIRTGTAAAVPVEVAGPTANLWFVVDGVPQGGRGLLYPVYAGLVAGYVGLYQINLRLCCPKG